MTNDVCPNCDSGRTRRGGTMIWAIYVLALLVGIPAVLLLHLPAGIIAAVLIAVIVLAHVLIGTRVCLDCGTQFR